jgi:archaellum biogenesis ATPase FlaH
MNKIIEELNSNLIYKISMSSIELFHSNFWKWLFDTNKSSLKYFLKNEFDFNEIDINEIDITREKQNLDLKIVYKSKKSTKNEVYIIENKIKSLADEDQIQRYVKKIEKKEIVKKVIITGLIEPDFKLENNWVYLSYEEIAHRLSQFVNTVQDTYQKRIISDYIQMVKGIDEIIKEKVKVIHNYTFSEDLKEIKFDAVYKKIFGGKILSEFKKFHSDENCHTHTKTALNRSNLTLSFCLKIKDTDGNEFRIGIQLEDYEYRKFFSKTNDPAEQFKAKGKESDKIKEEKKTRADDLYKKYSAFCKEWINDSKILQYVSVNETFIYIKSMKKIKNMKLTDLYQHIENDIFYLHKLVKLNKEFSILSRLTIN